MAQSKDLKEESGPILWVNEFTEAEAVRFHDRLMELYELNPHRPLVVHINSYGGEVDSLFAMIDSMDCLRAMAGPDFKILTVATGKAQSAGAALLSCGDYRFATPNTRIMLHQVVSGFGGGHAENEVEYTEINKLNTRLLKLIKTNCKLKMSVTEFKKTLGQNLYMTPEQAKDLGLIDIVGYPKVVERVFYDLRVVNAEKPTKEPKSANRRANKKASKDQGED